MGGSSTPETQETTAVPWKPQGDALRRLFGGANNLLSQGPPDQFGTNDLNLQGTSTVSPQNQNQLDSQTQIRTNAPLLDTQAQQAIQANQSLFNADDVGNNPVVQQAIQSALNPLAKQFTTQVLPNLRLGGIDSGGSSSSRQGVIEANATNDFNQVSSNMVGQLMGQFYNQGLDAKVKSLALSPSLAGMTNAGAQNLANVGDAQQQFTQQQLNDEIARFNVDQNGQLTNLTNFRNLITGGFGGTTTSPTGVQDPSQFGQAAGGALAGYGSTGSPWGAAAGAIIPFL